MDLCRVQLAIELVLTKVVLFDDLFELLLCQR